jgi:molybdopterin-binding protein
VTLTVFPVSFSKRFLHRELKICRRGDRDLLSWTQTSDENKDQPHKMNRFSRVHESSQVPMITTCQSQPANKLHLIESAITRRSADELKPKKGDAVAAVVKATEVMIQND